MGCLILQLAAERKNVRLCRLSLRLRALQLDLAIVDLDINVKLLTKLANVAATSANEVIGKLLGKFKLQGKPALLFILLLLLNEGLAFSSK